MIVITDSNIIVSALISPVGVVASVFKEKSNLQFIAPSQLLEEVKEHWDVVVEFSSLSARELFSELKFYEKRINFSDSTNIPRKYRLEAYQLVKDIDEDDADFVALHLYKKHKLWTGDKKLIKGLLAKGYDICVTTDQLKQKLYKKTISKLKR